MSQINIILICLFCLFGLQNCQKKCHLVETGEEVSFHFLDDHTFSGIGCAIDESSVTIQEIAFIRYDQILSYDPESHVFGLDTQAVEWLREREDELHQKAFAVTVDGELIYTCYFWLAWSSLSCDWYTTDPLMLDYFGGLKIKGAYPGDPDRGSQEKRNDKQILCIFE